MSDILDEAKYLASIPIEKLVDIRNVGFPCFLNLHRAKARLNRMLILRTMSSECRNILKTPIEEYIGGMLKHAVMCNMSFNHIDIDISAEEMHIACSNYCIRHPEDELLFDITLHNKPEQRKPGEFMILIRTDKYVFGVENIDDVNKFAVGIMNENGIINWEPRRFPSIPFIHFHLRAEMALKINPKNQDIISEQFLFIEMTNFWCNTLSFNRFAGQVNFPARLVASLDFCKRAKHDSHIKYWTSAVRDRQAFLVMYIADINKISMMDYINTSFLIHDLPPENVLLGMAKNYYNIITS